ncbi:flagellar hook-basal body complex protein [Clostridium algidicarnis]|uniref:Flagellar basal body rod protein FlgG n=1 Tax=Clostridium algidicarnis TaxID=37659 RepID=A0ABS6BZA6_9CLOT|nr:flagellar hook-basal body complex protein [Clostridium algidicarnis]MBB6630473.1 flagellar basal body rod protein FlgG [Clostridium algidicarnis]MBB6696390.1 flagellar basal body rod protein FlgG [Clostridium algidicarnis]MBU3193934.1 flagellar basal body rod protein FlgG [Clostridium algidicarnis]MBU3202985.1 flagellar basal body rod protein FlgG [Clostridium algidicarnis]MBU3205716.1 flagellar basal body rod protein FlgG [Clostridium algidicarnis]
MIRGIYTAVSGLIAEEANQNVISSNMANANTVGYKSDSLIIKNFGDVLIENYDKVAGGKNVRNTIGGLSLGSKIDETVVDFTGGSIESTDKETDFAIEGRGFFTVRKNPPNGNGTFYTRDGHFHTNSRGYLVTDSGDDVMGINSRTGATEPIFVGNAKLTMDYNGNLKLNDVEGYRLSTVDFQDYKGLKKIGDNLYQGENPINTEDILIKHKALERSNVNVIEEMVNMMTVMRNFETNQKIVQTLDETLNKAANEIGAVR